MPSGKRLHISPLNAQLLPSVLSAPLSEKASNISFHTIQTFPEKDYGYVDLPNIEAEKLKKKLNGSTLKGLKMRVEEARPKKQKKGEQTQDEGADGAGKVGKKSKKQERAKEEGLISGHELQGRKVKRGWTEPSTDAKPSKRRKDRAEKMASIKAPSATGNTECLFKMKLPPNASTSVDTKDGKTKKRKRGESTRNVVVHEFANNTKHAGFLRDQSGAKGKKSASEYVEGKGWVDEDGNVVEAEPKRRKSKTKPDPNPEPAPKDVKKPRSRRSSRLEAPAAEVVKTGKLDAPIADVDDQTSSSGTSSSDIASDSDSTERSLPPGKAQGSRKTKQNRGLGISGDDGIEVDRVERLSITRSSATEEPSQEPAPTSAPTANEVHPLEALFKRPQTAASHTPKKPNLEVSTSFSFFDPDVDEGGSQSLRVPQTPFTQQDLRQRRQRSAAPTPDTAAPGKTFGNLWEGTSDISGGEDDMEASTVSGNKDKSATPDIKEEKPESDFSKWFWEHRGENNRAWKRRRREAAKEKRQKENKERRG